MAQLRRRTHGARRVVSALHPTSCRHNIGVDWRLLHRQCPDLTPAGLIDTLRLARTLDRTTRNNLAALIQRFELTDDVNRLAVGSTPQLFVSDPR